MNLETIIIIIIIKRRWAIDRVIQVYMLSSEWWWWWWWNKIAFETKCFYHVLFHSFVCPLMMMIVMNVVVVVIVFLVMMFMLNKSIHTKTNQSIHSFLEIHYVSIAVKSNASCMQVWMYDNKISLQRLYMIWDRYFFQIVEKYEKKCQTICVHNTIQI